MKKKLLIALAAVSFMTFQACKSQSGKPEGFSQSQIDSVSYAIGLWFAQPVKHDFGDLLNPKVIVQAIQDFVNDKETKIKPEDIGHVINEFLMKKRAIEEEKFFIEGEKALKEGEAFLEANKAKEGVVELPSGLQYKILEEGTGARPTEEDVVVVNYVGTLVDGKVFNTSEESGGPATFPLNGVIAGWTEGIQLLKEGGKAILYIPHDLAYQATGRPPVIPPYATLIFEVELIEVKKQ